MQEKELNRSAEQARTRRRAALLAAVSSPHYASAGTDGPNASPDPAVETLEELADVGAFVILAPTPQEWIKPRNQFLGSQRCRPFGAFPYLTHETTNRLLLGIRVERTLSGLTTNLAAGQIKLPPPALDFVAEELEAVSDMNNPRLLRM